MTINLPSSFLSSEIARNGVSRFQYFLGEHAPRPPLQNPNLARSLGWTVYFLETIFSLELVT